MTIAFFQQFAQCLAHGAVVLATVVDVTGSVPREIGAKMLVNAQGEIWGTIGGGAGEAKVIGQALRMLESADPQGAAQGVEIDLSGAGDRLLRAPKDRDIQGVCGGRMRVWLQCWQGSEAIALVQAIITTLQTGSTLTLVTPYDSEALPYLLQHPTQAAHHSESAVVDALGIAFVDAFVEVLAPPPRLLIVGAGHCGIQLAKVVQLLDFQVIVQDDRPAWANPSHYSSTTQIFTESIETVVSKLSDQIPLYVALVTRGYQYDVQALKTLLSRPVPCTYIGMIGSQKRVRRVLKAVALEQRLPHPALASPVLHAPIGLDIGALTPAEIAISIAAELIMVRRGGTGHPLTVV